MNKLYRYILVGILALIPCFSHADLILEYSDEKSLSNGNYGENSPQMQLLTGYDMLCFKNINCASLKIVFYPVGGNGNGFSNFGGGESPGLGYCVANYSSVALSLNSSCTIRFDYYNFSNYTSLQCQTEYNLIPISSVTAQYCKLNFNLINPSECPISGGTGAVNWSSLFINGTQYPGNANISVYIPEYIARSITYNDNENIVDIEGYNADTDYIENVINNEKLTPTNEDFTLLLQGLVNFIPYLFIGLLILRAVKIFNRIWK